MNTNRHDSTSPSAGSIASLPRKGRRGWIALAGFCALAASVGSVAPAAPSVRSSEPVTLEVSSGTGAGILEVRSSRPGALEGTVFGPDGGPVGRFSAAVGPLSSAGRAELSGVFDVLDPDSGLRTQLAIRGRLDVHPGGIAVFYGALLDPDTGADAGLFVGNAAVGRGSGDVQAGRFEMYWEHWG